MVKEFPTNRPYPEPHKPSPNSHIQLMFRGKLLFPLSG
jgi:hypothetical protein